jgi:hypothetical protein
MVDGFRMRIEGAMAAKRLAFLLAVGWARRRFGGASGRTYDKITLTVMA